MKITDFNLGNDEIFLMLPDGRPIIGRALIVQEPVKWPGGGGGLRAEFAVDPRTPVMEMCVVLMKLDKPMRPSIILRG